MSSSPWARFLFTSVYPLILTLSLWHQWVPLPLIPVKSEFPVKCWEFRQFHPPISHLKGPDLWELSFPDVCVVLRRIPVFSSLSPLCRSMFSVSQSFPGIRTRSRIWDLHGTLGAVTTSHTWLQRPGGCRKRDKLILDPSLWEWRMCRAPILGNCLSLWIHVRRTSQIQVSGARYVEGWTDDL